MQRAVAAEADAIFDRLGLMRKHAHPAVAIRRFAAQAAERLAHASGPTLTNIFPMFSPRRRPRNAFGAFSIPSTTVSR